MSDEPIRQPFVAIERLMDQINKVSEMPTLDANVRNALDAAWYQCAKATGMMT